MFDLNVHYTDEVINELKEKLEAFDSVAILVNNATVTINKQFDLLENADIASLMNVNIVTPTVVTRLLIPKLLERGKKGGIVNVGSESTKFKYAGLGMFSSTKAYLTHLSSCLSEEYKEKLDIMTTTVGPTKTSSNPAVEVFASTPESVAKHTLDTLGWESHTFGDYKHGLRHYYLNKYCEGKLIRWIDRRRNNPK